MKTNPGDGLIELELDEGRFPRDAVYAAGFSMIDRCWVHLDRAGAGRLKIALRAKSANADLDALSEEVESELFAHAWRLKVVEDSQSLIDAVATKAFGGAAAEGSDALDALLAEGGEGEEGAFDDPLGIAMSWEEKYGKKADGTEGQAS